MTRYLAFALAVMTLLSAAYGAGRWQERAAFQARLDRATVTDQAAAAETARAFAVAEQMRRQLSQQLEDQANAEPVSSPACLSLGRVRRINLH